MEKVKTSLLLESFHEGIPDWAVITDELTLPFALPVADVYTLDKNGYPSIEDCLTVFWKEDMELTEK